PAARGAWRPHPEGLSGEISGVSCTKTRGTPQYAEMPWTRHLASRPSVSGGELSAKGTRGPVAVILDSLAEGATQADILRSYLSLKPIHVRAALAYAAQLVREEQLIPL